LITSFIQKITKQGVINGEKFSYLAKEVNPVYLSRQVLQILKNTGNLDQHVQKDQRVGLRNFFVQHAALGHTLCRAI